MATGQYVGVNGVARKGKAAYIGVGGVARKVGKGYIGVGGVARQFLSGLPPIGTPLASCTWEQIRKVSDAGQAANYFSVGDTKTISLVNVKIGIHTIMSQDIDAFILGFNHNASVEGENRIHFSIGKISGKDVALCDGISGSQTSTTGTFAMNTSNTNSGGWNSSHMRKTVLGSDSTPISPTANTLLAALPSGLKAVMKSITKYTDNTGDGINNGNYVTTTTDYLPLLAEFEVFGTRKYANSTEKDYQKQYDYYKAGNSKTRYKYNATTVAATWWLRSPHATNGNGFCTVNSNSNAGAVGAYYSLGVTPIFAV